MKEGRRTALSFHR